MAEGGEGAAAGHGVRWAREAEDWTRHSRTSRPRAVFPSGGQPTCPDGKKLATGAAWPRQGLPWRLRDEPLAAADDGLQSVQRPATMQRPAAAEKQELGPGRATPPAR